MSTTKVYSCLLIPNSLETSILSEDVLIFSAIFDITNNATNVLTSSVTGRREYDGGVVLVCKTFNKTLALGVTSSLYWYQLTARQWVEFKQLKGIIHHRIRKSYKILYENEYIELKHCFTGKKTKNRQFKYTGWEINVSLFSIKSKLKCASLQLWYCYLAYLVADEYRDKDILPHAFITTAPYACNDDSVCSRRFVDSLLSSSNSEEDVSQLLSTISGIQWIRNIVTLNDIDYIIELPSKVLSHTSQLLAGAIKIHDVFGNRACDIYEDAQKKLRPTKKRKRDEEEEEEEEVSLSKHSTRTTVVDIAFYDTMQTYFDSKPKNVFKTIKSL